MAPGPRQTDGTTGGEGYDLPPGYGVLEDPDLLVVSGPSGEAVGAYSGHGHDPCVVARDAWGHRLASVLAERNIAERNLAVRNLARSETSGPQHGEEIA